MADASSFGKMSDFMEDPPATKWIYAIAWLVFGVVMLALGVFFFFYTHHEASTLTGTATATVKGSPHEITEQDCNGSKTCSDDYYCEFHYVFSAPMGGEGRGDGRDEGHCGDKQADGAQREVFFNPEDITQSTLEDPDSLLSKYGWLAFIFAGIVVVIVGVRNIPRRQRATESKSATHGEADGRQGM